MQLVSVEQNLVEGSLAPGQSLALLNPGSGGCGSGDVNLALTTGGDDIAQLAEDVPFPKPAEFYALCKPGY
mgnify:CR=1 FL=1